MNRPELSWLLNIEVGTGTLAVAYADLRPPQGQQWLVEACYLTHDDPAPPTAQWLIRHPGGSYALSDLAAAAINTKYYLYQQVTLGGLFVINYEYYLRAGYSAMAAGKHGTVSALVYKLRGVPIHEET